MEKQIEVPQQDLWKKENDYKYVSGDYVLTTNAHGNMSLITNIFKDKTSVFRSRIDQHSPRYICITFPVVCCVNLIRVYNTKSGYTSPKKLKIEGSVSGEFTGEEDEIGYFENIQWGDNEYLDFNINNSNKQYKSIKINILEMLIEGNSVGLGYTEFYEIREGKFLLKQNNQYYTIKSEYYSNGQFQPLTLEGGEQPNENDYEKFGSDDVNDLLISQNTKAIQGTDMGILGEGKYFELGLDSEIKKINSIE